MGENGWRSWQMIIQAIWNQFLKGGFLLIMVFSGILYGYITKNFNSITSNIRQWKQVMGIIAITIYFFYTGVTFLTNGMHINDFGFIAVVVSCIVLMIPEKTTKKSREGLLRKSVIIALVCYAFGFLQLCFPNAELLEDFFLQITITGLSVIFNIVNIVDALRSENKDD